MYFDGIGSWKPESEKHIEPAEDREKREKKHNDETKSPRISKNTDFDMFKLASLLNVPLLCLSTCSYRILTAFHSFLFSHILVSLYRVCIPRSRSGVIA